MWFWSSKPITIKQSGPVRERLIFVSSLWATCHQFQNICNFPYPPPNPTWQSTSQVFVSSATWVPLKTRLSMHVLILGFFRPRFAFPETISKTCLIDPVWWATHYVRSVWGSKAAKTLRNNGLKTRQIFLTAWMFRLSFFKEKTVSSFHLKHMHLRESVLGTTFLPSPQRSMPSKKAEFKLSLAETGNALHREAK